MNKWMIWGKTPLFLETSIWKVMGYVSIGNCQGVRFVHCQSCLEISRGVCFCPSLSFDVVWWCLIVVQAMVSFESRSLNCLVEICEDKTSCSHLVSNSVLWCQTSNIYIFWSKYTQAAIPSLLSFQTASSLPMPTAETPGAHQSAWGVGPHWPHQRCKCCEMMYGMNSDEAEFQV